jgi:hypothetical protein
MIGVSFPFRIDHCSHMLAFGAGRTQIGAAVHAPEKPGKKALNSPELP